jgi:hypothetical protein
MLPFHNSRTAGATVARSTPDRKVIRSNRVWFNTSYCLVISFCFLFVIAMKLITWQYVLVSEKVRKWERMTCIIRAELSR